MHSLSSQSRKRLLLRFCLFLCVVRTASAESVELRTPRTSPDGENHIVQLVLDQDVVLSSPPEGLWSIACGWKDGWPADWESARATQIERVADRTILTGQLEACGGTWKLRDVYQPFGPVIKCVRRFEWTGKQVAEKCTLSVRFQTRTSRARALLPNILYYGNPSGARSGRVPVFRGRSGEEAIFEEHRYPMPFAFIESATDRNLTGVALHALPCPVPYGNLDDQWWSLGVAAQDTACELVLLSGPCASNGLRSVVKASQQRFLSYDNAYLDVPPGAIIEKTFFLEAFPVAAEGSGFRRPVQTSLELFGPFKCEDMPTIAGIVRDKYHFAKRRWRENAEAAGFSMFPEHTGLNYLVLGWCGQTASPGYALQVLADGLGDPEAKTMARKSLDFLSTAQFYAGGFHTYYNLDKNEWSHDEPLSQAQAMLNFANAIRVGRQRGAATAKWEAFLRKACDFHADRILEPDWRPVSTDQAFFIAPLCQTFKLFGNDTYRQAAVKAGNVYADRHLSMREPYWGGTLDASCEDKEGAYAALQGFLALHELTGDAKYLTWAEHACDVVLSYVVVWDIPMPAGRLSDHRLRTRGWTGVSPQNQCLDVYGVLIAPDVYQLGQLTKRTDLQQLALLMYRTCGQMIDHHGSQGEQFQQTNFAQGQPPPESAFGLRGGYNEEWTVFWITAHFLNAAARFAELGVPVWNEPVPPMR